MTKDEMTTESNETLAYIRQYYGVPAFVGTVITYGSMPATIIGGSGPYLKVLCQGQELLLHPTWRVEYPDAKEDSDVS